MAAVPRRCGHQARARAVLLSLPPQATYPSCGVACAQDVRTLIQTETRGKSRHDRGADSRRRRVRVPPKEYFEIVSDRARARRPLHRDEVQTGCGRTGTGGASRTGTSARHPDDREGDRERAADGVTVATAEVADSFRASTSDLRREPVTTTAARPRSRHGGDRRPELRRDRRPLQGRARASSAYPQRSATSGAGLMQGVELVTDETATTDARSGGHAAREETKKRELLIGRAGSMETSRLAPPMIVSASEVDEALEDPRRVARRLGLTPR